MKSIDGLMEVTNPEFYKHLEAYNKIVQDRELKKEKWIQFLRANDYQMAMPNDGWVDRESKTFTVVYPYFCNQLKIGSKVALGDFENYYSAQITSISSSKFFRELIKYSYQIIPNQKEYK